MGLFRQTHFPINRYQNINLVTKKIESNCLKIMLKMAIYPVLVLSLL